jgi:DNA sulfur modification protein DndE
VSLKQIRLSAQAKEQLIRLKAKTGVGRWNILCRWAFCLSLRQPTAPTPIEVPADSNVEMTRQAFGWRGAGAVPGAAEGALRTRRAGQGRLSSERVET